MQITISEDKVTLTQWDNKVMYAVSFQTSLGESVEMFEKLLSAAKHRLMETVFTHGKHGKRIKSKK